MQRGSFLKLPLDFYPELSSGSQVATSRLNPGHRKEIREFNNPEPQVGFSDGGRLVGRQVQFTVQDMAETPPP